MGPAMAGSLWVIVGGTCTPAVIGGGIVQYMYNRGDRWYSRMIGGTPAVISGTPAVPVSPLMRFRIWKMVEHLKHNFGNR